MVTVKYRIKSRNNSINHWNSSGVTDGVKKNPTNTRNEALDTQPLHILLNGLGLLGFSKFFLATNAWSQNNLVILKFPRFVCQICFSRILISVICSESSILPPKKHLPHKMHLKCADILRLLIHARHKFLEDHSCYIKPLKAQI